MQERKLMELAEAAGNIAIVGHVRPDGDCVGSCLAVCNYITEQYPEKTVDVYLETPPAKFSYLKQFERICSDPDTGNQYDLCICLDSGDRERLGKNVVYLNTAKTSICIDHHITNQGYAAANFVKADASATCEVLYDFLDEEKISRDVAECIYTGILHDTNVFKNSNTTQRTMHVAGAMMAKGIIPMDDKYSLWTIGIPQKDYVNQLFDRVDPYSVLFYLLFVVFIFEQVLLLSLFCNKLSKIKSRTLYCYAQFIRP